MFVTTALLFVYGVVGCGNAPKDELWVIGLDGGDWDILEPLMAAGRMPNLKRLRDEGAWGPMRSEQPMLSPVLWTTIATGRTPDQHGVTWFMSTASDGTKIPISSVSRKVRTFWDVASENKVRSGVIGWWATWPVEPIDGFMVSDYVGWHSFGVTGTVVDQAGKVWPESMADDVFDLMPAPESVPTTQLQTILHLPDDRLQGRSEGDDPYENPVVHVREAMATARGYTDIALDRLANDRPRLLAVYYEGTDAVMHLFNNYAAPKQEWVSDEDFAAYRDAVDAYWSWQDALIGELLARRGPRTTIVVCSDHGFRHGDERLREESIDRADASHMVDGIIVLNGPDVIPGARISDAGVFDVAPTILRLMDLPLSQELSGRALTAALISPFRTSHPPRRVPTYETHPLEHGRELVSDPAAAKRMESMLRSLGYVSGGGNVSVGAENAVNMATIYMREGKLAEAVRTLEQENERAPGNRTVRLNLAQALARSGRDRDALKMYRALRAETPRDLVAVEDYALALMNMNQVEHAVAVYDSGLAVDPKWAVGLAGKGFGLHRLGRSSDGAALVSRAQQLDPRLAAAYRYGGLIAMDQNDASTARQQFTRALELDPLDDTSAIALSNLLMTAGDMPGALAVVQHALEAAGNSPTLEAQMGFMLLQGQRPDDAVSHLRAAAQAGLPSEKEHQAVLGNLGIAQAMSGDVDGGITTFREIVQQWPDNADAHGQLGIFLARTGQKNDAVRELKQAVDLAPDNTSLKQALEYVQQR